jgi:hypothetical protein
VEPGGDVVDDGHNGIVHLPTFTDGVIGFKDAEFETAIFVFAPVMHLVHSSRRAETGDISVYHDGFGCLVGVTVRVVSSDQVDIITTGYELSFDEKNVAHDKKLELRKLLVQESYLIFVSGKVLLGILFNPIDFHVILLS